MPKSGIGDKTLQIGIRLENAQIAILDSIAGEMRKKMLGVKTSRSDIARYLMYLGLAEFEKNPIAIFEK